MSASRLAPLLLAALIAAPSAARADASTDYVLHCRGCHGPDGGGAAGAVPSFRGQVATFLRVEGGREYLVRVPGTSQSELSDARIAVLLNWIVEEFDPGGVPPEFVPYTEAEVARLRRPPLVDVESLRRHLLLTAEHTKESVRPR